MLTNDKSRFINYEILRYVVKNVTKNIFLLFCRASVYGKKHYKSKPKQNHIMLTNNNIAIRNEVDYNYSPRIVIVITKKKTIHPFSIYHLNVNNHHPPRHKCTV